MIHENRTDVTLFDSVYAQYRKRNKGKLLLLSAFSFLAIAAGIGISIIRGDYDFFLGVAALFASLMSVFIAIEANNLNALMYAATLDNNSASVRPYLQMDTFYKSSNNELTVSLRNTGIGPAMITEMWAWVGNENSVDPDKTVFYHTVFDLFFDVLDKSTFSADTNKFFSDCVCGMNEVEFYTIPPNESIDIIHIKFGKFPINLILIITTFKTAYSNGNFPNGLNDFKVIQPFSGRAYDNAVAKSFFVSLKSEQINQNTYSSFADLYCFPTRTKPN